MLQAVIHRHISSDCQLCGLRIAENQTPKLWCHHCEQMLLPAPYCQCCGLPTKVMQPHCGHCLKQPPPWQRLYHLGIYQPPLSHLIHQFKFNHQYWMGKALAPLLASTITEPATQLISVPLHWRRYLSRGYNQSDLLARALAEQLPNAYYRPRVFHRTRHTPFQRKLARKQRLKNLAGAFELTAQPNAQHVAIVDDVVTTGSTVRQLCQLLLDVGVKNIDIYCLSRTPDSPS